MSSIVICEKPSQARNIIAAIGNNYGEVLSAQGHLLQLEEPHDVNPDWKNWGLDLLMPPKGTYWYKVDRSAGKGERFDKIKAAVKGASQIIIATDCDREGQAIGEEIIRFLGFKGKVLRAMFTSEDPVTLQKIFSQLEPNEKYKPLYDAAVARQQVDQIYNLTLTRVATLSLKDKNAKGVIGIGRVKTPTLGIVCKRELDIRNFVSKEYFEVSALITDKLKEALLLHQPKDDERLFDKKAAEVITEKAKGFSGPINVKTELKRQSPPKPMDLPSLQKKAGSWGWTAKKVLDTAQSLYETHKITTYPRAETRYLPETFIDQAGQLLKSLKTLEPFQRYSVKEPIIRKGKSGVFSNTALEGVSHHAIIPNINTADQFSKIYPQLDEDEKRLFNLIAQSYLAAIGIDHEYNRTEISFDVAVNDSIKKFLKAGSIPVVTGWKEIFQEDEEDAKEEILPAFKNGDLVSVKKADVLSKWTQAPKRYNEGTLIDAMQNAWKFVDNPQEKERLKEAKGIGTPATRDTVIEGLKSQNLIEIKKKDLVPTETGLQLYELIKNSVPILIDVATTARMEERLDSVLLGKTSTATVIQEIAATTQSIISIFSKGTQTIIKGSGTPTSKMIAAAKNVAERNSIKLDKSVLESFEVCQGFLNKYLKKADDGGAEPSEKQLAYALSLAKETGRDLPEDIKTNSKELSGWIDAAKQQQPEKLPTEKQMEWIKKLVDKGAEAPKGWPDKITFDMAKKFLDQQFKK